ncbi:uncharacterized protein METZ01_LOCUS271134 [marine metagenome]|uniref:Uncharacterized protein n=1 Tax=marine metagenome TaxID=408172 RepID=A0A382K1E8_9ZZZZ
MDDSIGKDILRELRRQTSLLEDMRMALARRR